MSSFAFTIENRLKITNKTSLGRQIVEECLKRINKDLPRVEKELKSFASVYIERAIRNSATYNSIVSGGLQAHFGLVDPKSAMDQFIRDVKDLIRVTHTDFKVTGNQYTRNITGGVTVSVIGEENNQRLLLASPLAAYNSSGGPVDWLEWLLFEGASTVVFDYGIKFGNFPETYSRTGKAIMIPDLRGYEVPYEHAGTENDNFLTKALRSIESELDRVFKITLAKLK